MAYLGMVLKKLIYSMSQHYNQEVPFMYSKNDIKDGFWRMNVSKNDAWNFCYVLPSLNKQQSLDDVEIVVPHALQMGWCKSPPYFSTASETARDIIQFYVNHTPIIPPHPPEHLLHDNKTRCTVGASILSWAI